MADGEFDYTNDGVDDYQSEDDSGAALIAQGSAFSSACDNFILLSGQLFMTTDKFMKVVSIFAIENYLKLQMIDNEKSRIIL